jgi:hypothetical protein
MRLPLPFWALALAAACSNPQTPVIAYCAATRPVAVEVTVLDSISGASLADGAYGSARVGAEVDSLRLSSPPPVLQGGTKLGTYDLTVEHPGYREWTRTGVVVSQQGTCGNPVPVALVARLQPVP